MLKSTPRCFNMISLQYVQMHKITCIKYIEGVVVVVLTDNEDVKTVHYGQGTIGIGHEQTIEAFRHSRRFVFYSPVTLNISSSKIDPI